MANEEYSPLVQDDVGEERETYDNIRRHTDKTTQSPIWLYGVILFLLLFNGIQIAISLTKPKHIHESSLISPPELGILPEIPTQYKKFWWNTEYSTSNQTLQDELWDSITWTHGLIAVEHEWAKSQNWHDTFAVPGDDSKRVYLLEAYHEVHCLRFIRETVKLGYSGVENDDTHVRRVHTAHCFDALLQAIMCNADSTPLWSPGSTYVGHGQTRKCRDWERLRDYAAEKTACYREIDNATLEEQFGHCDHGDGLIFGTPQQVDTAE